MFTTDEKEKYLKLGWHSVGKNVIQNKYSGDFIYVKERKIREEEKETSIKNELFFTYELRRDFDNLDEAMDFDRIGWDDSNEI